jgi:hypothetical protein
VGGARSIKSGVTLREVTVGEGGRVSLSAGQSSSVQVEGAAKLDVAESADQFPWLMLTQGRAFAQVAPGDHPIMVGVRLYRGWESSSAGWW